MKFDNKKSLERTLALRGVKTLKEAVAKSGPLFICKEPVQDTLAIPVKEQKKSNYPWEEE